MSDKKFPAYEPLDDQLRMLKGDIRPDNALKSAVVGAQASTVIIPARVHVKQTAKAVLLYAACIALFLGAIMLLPRLFSQQTPVGTQPGETTASATTTPPVTDRDTITNPEQYTEQELRARQIVWEAIKNTTTEYTSINSLKIGYIYEFGEILVCIKGLHPGNCDCLPSPDQYKIVLGHMMRHPQGLPWEVYYKGNVYSLEDAYHAGILTEENLLTIGKDHFIDFSLDESMLLTSHIRTDSLASFRFTPDDAETTNIDSLFDGIKSQEALETNGKGQMTGNLTYNALFFFDLDAPAQIAAYVITTGSDATASYNPNPLGWMLYGTNDADAAAAMRTEGATIEALQDSGKWTILTFTWDGGMKAENFSENIYIIEPEKRGEYQYYCWCVEYTGGTRLQVAELELYAEDESHSTTPEIPANRDTLANPEQYTELELQAIYAIWAAYKETHQEFLTINDILPDDVSIHGDAVVCYDYVGTFPGDAISVNTALGYRFVYPSLQQKRVFANGTVYTFQEAYDAGVLTEEDIRALWEEHKKQYPILNEQYA